MTATGQAISYHLFDTALGPCAIGWSASGIARFQLPDADEDATRRRMMHGGARPAAPPAAVAAVIASVREHLAGRRTAYAEFAIDLAACQAADRRVLEATFAIPWGSTLSYGELARAAGLAGEARRVGQILGRNPVPLIVPCHRILAKDGGRNGILGGFSAPGGTETKQKLLALEGVIVPRQTELPL